MKPQDTLKHILDTTIDLTYVLHYLLTTSIHLLFSLPCHAHLLAPLFTCHAHSPTPFTPMPRPPAQSFTCHAHLPTPFTPMPRPPTCSIIYLPRPFTYSFHSHATPTCPIIYLPRPLTSSTSHIHFTYTHLYTCAYVLPDHYARPVDLCRQRIYATHFRYTVHGVHSLAVAIIHWSVSSGGFLLVIL